MSSAGAYGLGYKRVDDDPNLPVLIATMDATSRWDATRELRAWERDHLRLTEGERLLDVGCGLGEAAIVLSRDLGASGEVVGVDTSVAMLTVARARAEAEACPVRCSVGDALALGAQDRCFDVVRSERTLQWVTDPRAAVAEMVRVLRSGGRLALIDTDWSTLHLDVGDDEMTAAVHEAMRFERNRPSNVGSRLTELTREAGLDAISTSVATQVWTRWDPDASPAPDGCFSMDNLAADLVETGHLNRLDADRFVATTHDAARHGHFFMSLTMFAVVALSGSAEP